MLQSLAILYAEHALARKIKYDKIFSDFADKVPPIADYVQQQAVMCRKEYRCFFQTRFLTLANRAIAQGTQ